MIEESIKAVREAEANAEALLAKAREEAAGIVKEAEARAVLDKDSAAKDRTNAEAEAAKKAREDGEALLAKAKAEADEAVSLLKARVAPRTEDAIAAVIKAIL